MSGSYTRIGLEEAGEGSRTDWQRLRSLSDAEIDAAIAADPDSYPIGDSEFIGRRGGSYAYEVFQDSTGAWRWLLRAAGGEVLAASGRSFDSRDALEEALTELRAALLGARSKAA
ncbi:MAG TPA: DUF1508 domain-containing protein [Allosphingosinicella sp.]